MSNTQKAHTERGEFNGWRREKENSMIGEGKKRFQWTERETKREFNSFHSLQIIWNARTFRLETD